MRNKKFISLLALLASFSAFANSKIQNEDVKSYNDLKTAVLVTTGNLSIGSACIASPGSVAHLAAGLFIYDSTTSTNISAGTTVVAIPGTCLAGQIQMSTTAVASATGDTISFGGQLSQLINDSKIYVGANSINDTLFNAIVNGPIVSRTTTDFLQNKSLLDSNNVVVNASDSTKQLAFNLAGNTTARTLTLATNQTTNQSLSIPNVSSGDAVVTNNVAATLTNKTISTVSNVIGSGSALSGQALVANGSGGSAWATVGSTLSVASKSANYSVSASDDYLKGDGSSAGFTFTLPAAASNSGKVLRFKKTDSTFNQIAIHGNGSELIDGVNIKNLNTQNEEYSIVCDGTGWNVISHTYPKNWTSYVVTIAGSSSNPTKASSPATDAGFWRRMGDSIEVAYNYSATGTGAAAGSGAYLFSIPSGLTIDGTKTTIGTTLRTSVVGNGFAALSDSTPGRIGNVRPYDTTHVVLELLAPSADFTQFLGSAVIGITNAQNDFKLNYHVPITGWTE